MESEVPCCGGGQSGICLLIIHSIFKLLITPIPIFFQFSKMLNIPFIFVRKKHLKNHPKVLKKIESRTPTKLL